MKKSFLVSVFIFFVVNTILFSQSNVKFSQAFHSSNVNSISFRVVNPNIEIKSITGPVIVVETYVQISASNYNLLKYMIKKGRYNLNSKIDDMSKNMTLLDKELTKEIIIGGEKVEEEIKYVIYVPEHIEIIEQQIENPLI
ncbi:MAG: hypothetical protein MK207_13000 [Saprospiraceae bacterium]|nr:hypothetical protein [Saprospiraceae bacterium]